MSDLIDRQAAVDIYDDYNVAVENGELEAYGKHRKRILELPPAQSEPKSYRMGYQAGYEAAQRWIPCTPETMPDNEHDVLVTVEIRPVGRKPFRRVVRAFYTDGKHTDADSAYTWYELEEPDFDDNGNIIVPEGWWESSDYSEEVSQIDDFVISWCEQPKPWEGGQDGD